MSAQGFVLLPQTNWIQSGRPPEATRQNWFPWSCMPDTGWEKQLTVTLPGGAERASKTNLTFLTSLWAIKHGAPTVQLHLFLLLLCLFSDSLLLLQECMSGLTGTYHSSTTGEVIALSTEELALLLQLQASCLPCCSSSKWISLRWRGTVEGGVSEEERVRVAFGNPADQSCGILPQRQGKRKRDWLKESTQLLFLFYVWIHTHGWVEKVCLLPFLRKRQVMWRKKLLGKMWELLEGWKSEEERHRKGSVRLWKPTQGILGSTEGWRTPLERRGGMSWLSPMSWAKWTWTAVRGGDEDGEGQEASEEREQFGEQGEEEEEEERSQSCRQVLCWSSWDLWSCDSQSELGAFSHECS